MKSEVIHARIDSNVKNDSQLILNKIGISLSQAVDLFLRQVVLNKGMPFDLTLPQKEDLVFFAENVSSVDAGKPSKKAKQIMKLYEDGVIDFETAEFAIMRLHHE